MLTKVVNDFSITVGTVNGSGSQTANTTILRALFKMGIPVSGKNMGSEQESGGTRTGKALAERSGFGRLAG